MYRLVVIAITAALSACAAIDHTTSIKQKVDSILLAGPGDLLLKIERERNLENAFGKSDIFGRKTKEGFTELRFAGVEASGQVVLVRKDVQIMTNETTMSRTPFATTTGRATTSVTGSASAYGNVTQIQGTGTTSYSSTTLVPQTDFHVIVPSDSVAVRLAPGEKRLAISGYIIEIISASTNTIEYKISKQD
jgi:hypothetical protein